MKIEMWPIEKPIPYEKNPRKNDAAVKHVANSIEQFGFRVPIVVDADGVIREGAVFYIWHADLEGLNFSMAAKVVGWKVRECLVWKKSCLVLGRQDYQWMHEPCLYGWKEGAAHFWGNDRKQTTILEFEKPSRSAEHPTMKPVELFEYQIKNSSRPGDIVLDSFCGSGTTIIACEKSGRMARGMEISPHYCDVIRRRWAEFVHGEGCEWQTLTPVVEE